MSVIMSQSSRNFSFVPAKKQDIPLALNFRKILFDEMGVPENSLIDDCYEVLLNLYQEEFTRGRIQHFIAYNGEQEPVAITGALLKTDFPYYLFKPGYYGWIIDVYTVPQYRGRRLSSQLLQLTHQWLITKGVQEAKLIAVGSHAQRLYERLGYRATWEMSINLSGNKTYNELIDLKRE
jgi:GNAT superfamily N-acetyltransferase